MPQHVQRQLAASLYMKVGRGVVMDDCDGYSSAGDDDVPAMPSTTAPAAAPDAGVAANAAQAATGNCDGAQLPAGNRAASTILAQRRRSERAWIEKGASEVCALPCP
eukprot:396396-Pleurochrysis_carterae.AAC.1